MADDPRVAYWREALGDALDRAGVYDALNAEQQAAVAEVLENWAESERTAFGDDVIPDPRDAQHERQIATLTGDHETILKARDAEIDRLKTTISTLRSRIFDLQMKVGA